MSLLAACFGNCDVPYLSWYNSLPGSDSVLMRGGRAEISEYPEENQENFTAADEFMESLFNYFEKVR